ncbi:MAG: hypothetical protein V4581_03325 [Bacteroidota bacterium]
MNREDLRVVEFTVIEKTKAKKGKKTQKKAKKLFGFFHLWGTNVNGKGNERFFGLVEEAVTGSLLEVSYKDIRFLSEAEIEEYHETAEAEAEETTEAVIVIEEIVAAPAVPAADETETAQPDAAAPAKPKTVRKPKA